MNSNSFVSNEERFLLGLNPMVMVIECCTQPTKYCSTGRVLELVNRSVVFGGTVYYQVRVGDAHSWVNKVRVL